MGVSSNFDLDEFVNYLLSGSFFLVFIISSHPLIFEEYFSFFQIENDAVRSASTWVLLLTLAMFCGHVFSMVVRYAVRVILNSCLGDPENAILPCMSKAEQGKNSVACRDFFTDDFREAFAASFNQAFELDINKTVVRDLVPRLVRSYVLHHSGSATDIRNRVVRSRSFTANLAVSFIAASLVSLFVYPFEIHAFLWIAAATLIVKQRSLDEREAKELYTHFLSLDTSEKRG